jgi:hypothetical protein
MQFYHKYKKALEEHGYIVDEFGYVWDSDGNQSAGEDRYGNVQSKDPNVTNICRLAQAQMDAEDKPALKPKPKAAPRKKKVEE